MAIVITPTRTGKDVGLSDVASILSEQNQVLAQTAESQVKLEKSFGKYLKMLEGDRYDKLQDKMRAKQESTTETQTIAGSGMTAKGLLGGAWDYLKGFAKRIIPFALALFFGDEAVEYVTKLLKDKFGFSDETGKAISESLASTLAGGMLGFLLGGLKGSFYGLIFGAMMSKPAREKIAEVLTYLTGKEFDANDWQTILGAGVLATLLPALIKTSITTIIPNMMKLLFSPLGLLVTAAGLATIAAYKYYTDPEFKKKVDEYTKEYRDKIRDLSRSLADQLLEVMSTYTNEAKKMVNKALGKNVFITDEMRAQAEKNLTDSEKIALSNLRKQRDIIEADRRNYMDGGEEIRAAIESKYGLKGLPGANMAALAGLVTGLDEGIAKIIDPGAMAIRDTAGKSDAEIQKERDLLVENISLLENATGLDVAPEIKSLKDRLDALDRLIALKKARVEGAPSVPTGIERQQPTGARALSDAQNGLTIGVMDNSNTYNQIDQSTNQSSPMVLPSGRGVDYDDSIMRRVRVLATS